MPEHDRWLSVDEIANRLGIKEYAVYGWIREPQMPGHKMGRVWTFDGKEAGAWVKSSAAREAVDPAATEKKTDEAAT